MRVYFLKEVQILIRFRNIPIPRPGDKIFVNKTAIKCYFGMKLEKIGMSPNSCDKNWDFQHFSWEIQRLGSSNTDCRTEVFWQENQQECRIVKTTVNATITKNELTTRSISQRPRSIYLN